jgi:hypothetical protein
MGRRQAEALMVSECVVTRVTGKAFNDETGLYEPTVETVYSGKCDFRFTGTAFREVDGQSQLLTEQHPVLKLPVDGSAGVRVDDEGVLTAHPLDAGLVGMKFRIAGENTRTYATARRLPVEVVSGV